MLLSLHQTVLFYKYVSSNHVTVGASRKFCLNFTISWFEIRVNRPNSFMVYNYLFGVVMSYYTIYRFRKI